MLTKLKDDWFKYLVACGLAVSLYGVTLGEPNPPSATSQERPHCEHRQTQP